MSSGLLPSGLLARFHDRIDAIDGQAWDRLLPSPHPWVRHDFLAALEASGCIRPDWGWQPRHLGLYRDGQLVAAAPLYLKGNSHGEFVFDGAWAQAWTQAGGNYYPKLLNAVPYSPVTGPRLLAGSGPEAAALRQALVLAMQHQVQQLQLSSLHANFLTAEEQVAFGPDWLARSDLQYHWHNRGYADFDDFLAALTPKKRKNIRQERRRVSEHGLAIQLQPGTAFSPAEWTQLHALYRRTFEHKGNHAALSEAMFQRFGRELADRVLIAHARRQGQIIAMALFLRGPDTLYGRYWGAENGSAATDPSADDALSCLHFELCYYRGIEYCIRQGLSHFEPGAQGQRHKHARGFLPTATHSRHYLPHPGFRQAVQQALGYEAAAQRQQLIELGRHDPYHHREPQHEPASTP